MQAEIRALVERHCTTLKSELESVQASLSCLAGSVPPGAAELWVGVERTHKIKGSSGSIGFTRISAAAARLEKLLRDAHSAGSAEGAVPRIAAALDDLEDLVEEVRPEDSRLYNADFSSLSGPPLSS